MELFWLFQMGPNVATTAQMHPTDPNGLFSFLLDAGSSNPKKHGHMIAPRHHSHNKLKHRSADSPPLHTLSAACTIENPASTNCYGFEVVPTYYASGCTTEVVCCCCEVFEVHGCPCSLDAITSFVHDFAASQLRHYVRSICS